MPPPPLIQIETEIEGAKAKSLYDLGANITTISYEFCKKLGKEIFRSRNLRFRTMSGDDKILGTVFLRMKIFNIKKTMRMFVINKKNFKYDILVGLDSIYEFRLEQDYKGKITQAEDEKKKVSERNEIPRKRIL